LLFTFSKFFLTEVGVQEHHAVVHNLEVLGREMEITVELPHERVNIRIVNFDNKGLSPLQMLRLDDQVTVHIEKAVTHISQFLLLNGLMDLDCVEAIAEVLLPSKQQLFLHFALIVTETWRK